MRKKTIIVAVVVAVTTSHQAAAAWPDRSGDLPGLVSGKKIAFVAAVGGGALLGGLLYKKLHRKEPASALDIPGRLAFSQSDANLLLQNHGGSAISVSEVVLNGRGFEFTKPLKTPLLVSAGNNATIPIRATTGRKARLKLTYIENGKQFTRSVVLSSEPGQVSETK